MKYVITGGAGFVGINLIERLRFQQEINEIVIIDRFTYTSNDDVLKNLAKHDNKIKLITGDVRDSSLMNHATRGADIVVHLAAESFVDYSIDNPSLFQDVNVKGTVNVLEAVRNNSIPRLVHISTDEVWGEIVPPGKFTERHPYQPRNPYSASKAAADHFVSAWAATWGLYTVTVHFTNLYGAYQYPEKLIPITILRALLGLPILVYGDGKNLRSWLHINDAIDGLLAAIKVGKSGHSYIIGSKEEYSNIAIVNMILSYLSMPNDLVSFVTDRPGNDLRYAVDCSLAKNELMWTPQISIHDGLKWTIAWYKANQSWWKKRLLAVSRRRGEK